MAKRIRVAKQEAAPAGLPDAANAATNTAPKSKAATPSSAEGKHVMLPAFLSKTYEIFSMPEFSHVCGWNANGDTIIVSQLEAFVAMVLPRFFKHRNFPSFVRQLNLYGFHKTVLDSKRLEFQHPYFKRGRPDLLHHIKRKVSNSNHHNQQLVNSSIQQNSRLDAHREISDTLLREMKELRQRSDVMEKRLREVEIDNAIVRSDNLKLWKHLEQAKDKQLIMQEKMKKIMWILFQIYRGKQQNLPKLSGNDATGAVISEEYVSYACEPLGWLMSRAVGCVTNRLCCCGVFLISCLLPVGSELFFDLLVAASTAVCLVPRNFVMYCASWRWTSPRYCLDRPMSPLQLLRRENGSSSRFRRMSVTLLRIN